MKRGLPVLLLTAVLLAAWPGRAQTASPGLRPGRTSGQTGTARDAEALRLPPYRKTALPNGVTLMLMEKRGLPLASFTIALRTGTTEDPQGKEGLAALTNDLLRKGTRTKTAEQTSAELDFIGATFSTTENPDWLRVQAEFMKKDIAQGLALVADMVRSPVFPADEVEKLKKQRVDQIRSAKDRPMGVIGDYFNAFLFAGHPYGRPEEGDERSVLAITRDDVVKFHTAHYVAGNLIVAVAGDFDSVEMEKTLASQFGSMPAGKPAAVTVRAPEPLRGKHLLLVDKPDSTQTFFDIGNVGVDRKNPDRVAISVVNTLFGGRFTSVINTALRIKSGLTYGARSGFSQMRQPGAFTISSYTRNATTEKTLDMALEVLREYRENGPTEEQLQSAKAYVKGQFPPRIETSDQLASLLADFEIYGLDETEINSYYARVDAVTLAEARRVIQKYFPEENLAFVLIGKSAEVAALAKKYAPDVRTKSISDPGF